MTSFPKTKQQFQHTQQPLNRRVNFKIGFMTRLPQIEIKMKSEFTEKAFKMEFQWKSKLRKTAKKA